MGQFSPYQQVSGVAEASNGTQNITVIAAPGNAANKQMRLLKGSIQIIQAGNGGTGLAALEDGSGGTKLFTVPATAVGVFNFEFAEPGLPLTALTLLNGTVEGATTQATARFSVTGQIT